MQQRTRAVLIVGFAVSAACGGQQPEHTERAPTATPAAASTEEQAAEDHAGHEPETGAADPPGVHTMPAAAAPAADPHAAHTMPAAAAPAADPHAGHTMPAAAAPAADPHAGHAMPAAAAPAADPYAAHTAPGEDASALLALVLALLADPEVRSIIAEDPELRAYVGDGEAGPTTAGDSAAVAAVVQQFHAALAAGDSLAALALLADDAVILEGGALETREEYRGHHLPADIAFARAVTSTRAPIRVRVQGDVAWAASTGTTTGHFRDRPVSTVDAELMVLVRSTPTWRITAIHWSSRPRP